MNIVCKEHRLVFNFTNLSADVGERVRALTIKDLNYFLIDEKET